jgi:hypothetical protein
LKKKLSSGSLGAERTKWRFSRRQTQSEIYGAESGSFDLLGDKEQREKERKQEEDGLCDLDIVRVDSFPESSVIAAG